ncbi:MAG TPA: hypothetical protein VGF00_01180, partial [Acidimicrobiia bacterium]
MEQIPVTVGESEQRRIAALADALRDRDAALADDARRLHLPAPTGDGGRVRQGAGDGPALIFEDHGEIPLFTTAAPSALEYRSLLLAEDGDILALGGQRVADFEAYARDTLRLGEVDVLPRPEGGPGALPDALRADPAAMARLVRRAREGGSLTVIPYLSTAAAWRLAD